MNRYMRYGMFFVLLMSAVQCSAMIVGFQNDSDKEMVVKRERFYGAEQIKAKLVHLGPFDRDIWLIEPETKEPVYFGIKGIALWEKPSEGYQKLFVNDRELAIAQEDQMFTLQELLSKEATAILKETAKEEPIPQEILKKKLCSFTKQDRLLLHMLNDGTIKCRKVRPESPVQ